MGKKNRKGQNTDNTTEINDDTNTNSTEITSNVEPIDKTDISEKKINTKLNEAVSKNDNKQ